MEKLLKQPVKQVIRDYPALEKILAGFSIGCTNCSLGTCLLKDIVEIHNLTIEQEQLLMQRIADVVFPGRKVELPKIARKITPASGNHKLSPPLRELVDEHTIIKKLLARIPELTASIDISSTACTARLNGAIDFIRIYADGFHHAKEEKILFGFFDPASDIIASFVTEHETGRAHVRAVADGIKTADLPAIRDHLAAYGALLTEHIKKEDEILYPWMDQTLTDSQIGQLYAKFAEVNETYSVEVKKQIGIIDNLERSANPGVQ